MNELLNTFYSDYAETMKQLEAQLPASWLAEAKNVSAEGLSEQERNAALAEARSLLEILTSSPELCAFARFSGTSDDKTLDWESVKGLLTRFGGEKCADYCAMLPENVCGAPVRTYARNAAQTRLSQLEELKETFTQLLDADENVLSWSDVKKSLADYVELPTFAANYPLVCKAAAERISHLNKLKNELSPFLDAESVWSRSLKELIEKAEVLQKHGSLPKTLSDELGRKIEQLQFVQREHTKKVVTIACALAVLCAVICWLGWMHLRRPVVPVPPVMSGDIPPERNIEAEAARVIRVAQEAQAFVAGVEMREISDVGSGVWKLDGRMVDLDPFEEKTQTLVSEQSLTEKLRTQLRVAWHDEGGFFSSDIPEWRNKVAELKKTLTDIPTTLDPWPETAERAVSWLKNETSAPYLAFVAPWQGGTRMVIVSRDGRTVLVRALREEKVARLAASELESRLTALLLNGERGRVPSLAWDDSSGLVLLYAQTTDAQELAQALVREVCAR